ncbi:unnamed protein product [Lactuca saligna]|uniref:Uncharacterized protein n=1 Tax=Lactuca saligna TaxID=75948 RepID=A0AA36E8W5_LACSI|nr:unnamed protein product [Lactuca saligna]
MFSQEKNIMRTHVVALAFDGEEVWLNSTSFESFNTMVLHPNQIELISDDQNGNILVWDLIRLIDKFQLDKNAVIVFRWYPVCHNPVATFGTDESQLPDLSARVLTNTDTHALIVNLTPETKTPIVEGIALEL